jgi:hypothetical protein
MLGNVESRAKLGNWQLQLPRNLNNFKQPTDFQIRRRSLRKLTLSFEDPLNYNLHPLTHISNCQYFFGGGRLRHLFHAWNISVSSTDATVPEDRMEVGNDVWRHPTTHITYTLWPKRDSETSCSHVVSPSPWQHGHQPMAAQFQTFLGTTGNDEFRNLPDYRKVPETPDRSRCQYIMGWIRHSSQFSSVQGPRIRGATRPVRSCIASRTIQCKQDSYTVRAKWVNIVTDTDT